MGGHESNTEREVKLDAGLRFEVPDLTGILPGVLATRLPNSKLQAIYIDTVDLRLMRWGVTLRHRRDVVGGEGTESGWTLKLPMDADGVALVRNELSWPGPFGPVPAEVANMVRAQARTAKLLPVAKLLTERHRIDLRDSSGRKLGEVDDDVVSVMDGRRLAARFRQVEVEVTDAAPEDMLDAVLQALTVAGAVAGDDRPKVVRAIGPRASLGPDVVVPELDSRSTVDAVVGAAIAAGVTRMIRHDPGVRLGDDPEHVHQARVGTRRLRSDLRTFWRLLDPDWARPVREELGWLAAVLGEVRDADVLTGRLRRQIRTLGGVDAKPAAALLRRLAIQREEARVRLLAVLDSERYVLLLEKLALAAAHPPLGAPGITEGAAGALEGALVARAAPAPLMSTSSPVAISESLTPPVPLRPLTTGRSGLARSPSARPATSSESVVAALTTNGWTANAVTTSGSTAAGSNTAGSNAMASSPVASGNGPAPLPAPAPALPVPSTDSPGPMGQAGGSAGATATATATATGPGIGADSEVANQRGADVLPALVQRPWKHLQQAVDHLGEDPPDEALHQIRIRAKRMRYAAEAVSGVIGKPARQLAAAVAEVQGVLGDMQDAVVAEEWLRRQAGSSPPSQALVAGQLITFERQQQAACREAWGGPWKAASKKSLRKWLKA